MDFLAIDFETATPDAASPCELGIAVVRGGAVREVRQWLIKPLQWPRFSPFHIAVHGITPDHVAHAPRWEEVWDEVAALLEGGTVVAHNAAFDMAVLRGTLDSLRLPYPAFRYFCSVSLARRTWPGRPSYGLGALCALHGIPLRHHRAGDDARAAAEIVLRAGADSEPVGGLLQRRSVGLGAFFPGGHRTPGGKTVALGR